VALTAILISVLAVVGGGLIIAALCPMAEAPIADTVATQAIDWVALNAWPGSSAVLRSVNAPRRWADERDRAPHAAEREAQWGALLRASNSVTVELPIYATPVGRHRRAEAA
jgi:hypothetical protein